MVSSRALTVLLFCGLTSMSYGHGKAPIPKEDDGGRKIEFPNVAGYQTLVLDPHTHSSFSDGHVWPRIRVGEALRDGLDAMAVTEHLEYQPHLPDLPNPDRDRAYRITLDAADGSDLIVIQGSEVTREAEGHMNALFVRDSNDLIEPPEPQEPYDAVKYFRQAAQWPAQKAVKAANEQGAFVVWNHPDFPGSKNGIATMNEFQRNNIEQGLVHGIEIANQSYHEEAFQMALDYNLTVLGSSDIHELIDWQYEPHKGGHRPVTLVFAKDRSAAGIREALFEKRTVAWIENLLLGRAEQLNPLLYASLTLHAASYPFNDVLQVSISNTSDAGFRLQNKSKYGFVNGDMVDVPPHGTVKLRVKTVTRLDHIELSFAVLNALVAPKTPALITLKSGVKKTES